MYLFSSLTNPHPHSQPTSTTFTTLHLTIPQGQDNAHLSQMNMPKIQITSFNEKVYDEEKAQNIFDEFMAEQPEKYDPPMEAKDLGKLFEDWAKKTSF